MLGTHQTKKSEPCRRRVASMPHTTTPDTASAVRDTQAVSDAPSSAPSSTAAAASNGCTHYPTSHLPLVIAKHSYSYFVLCAPWHSYKEDKVQRQVKSTCCMAYNSCWDIKMNLPGKLQGRAG